MTPDGGTRHLLSRRQTRPPIRLQPLPFLEVSDADRVSATPGGSGLTPAAAGRSVLGSREHDDPKKGTVGRKMGLEGDNNAGADCSGDSVSRWQNVAPEGTPPIGSKPKVFLSVAEQSADLHAASLIRAIRARSPGATFVGACGPKMLAEQCEQVFDMTSHQAMLTGALGNAGRAYRMLAACERRLRMEHFDACVCIDSPVLHLPLAGRAQQAGVPVLYYIAPQMWAWGKYRIYKLRHRVDRVACIMPFEERFFRDQGIDARFVGHPLADQFARRSPDPEKVHAIRRRGDLIVALLPGSRKQVVSSVLPGQLDVARRIVSRGVGPGGVSFGISVANDRVSRLIEGQVASSRVPCDLYEEDHSELIEAADLVLVASGTTTLEVAFHHKPMIVMYQASRFFYHALARWMIATPYYSLPNILAGREVVPEFMPYYTSTEPIATRAIELLQSPQARRAMSQELAEVVRPLCESSASANTAAMLLDMIGREGHEHR